MRRKILKINGAYLCNTLHSSNVHSLTMQLLVSLLVLLPLCLATSEHQQLKNLAAAGNGLIKLDSTSFDILTSPKRTWSASIQLTALDKRRKCNPCQQFDPSWNTVAKVWSKVPAEHRDNHFFATLDFDDGPTVFQKVCTYIHPSLSTSLILFGPSSALRQHPSSLFIPQQKDLANLLMVNYHPPNMISPSMWPSLLTTSLLLTPSSVALSPVHSLNIFQNTPPLQSHTKSPLIGLAGPPSPSDY